MMVDELRQQMAALPDLPPSDNPHSWLARRHNIREMVAKEDPEEFIKWPTVQGTMFVGDGPVVRAELAELRADDWDRWRIAILDTAECGATRSKLVKMPTTGNMIHQAYHLMRFEKIIKQRVEEMGTILEFGGGYGSMARIAHNLGFRGGYAIHDLPEFSLLQEFYLRKCGVPATYSSGPIPRMDVDLFIALWSISEISPDVRMNLLEPTSFSYSLTAYSEIWDGWDNLSWYRGMAKYLRDSRVWRELKIKHMPGQYYLVGEPRLIKQVT